MAISRRPVIVIVAVAIPAVLAALLLIELQKPFVIDINQPLYWITDVQFDKGYLNITVNTNTRAVIISEAKVSQTVLPLNVSKYQTAYRLISTCELFQPVPVDGQVLIRLSLNWTSDYGYYIELINTDGYIVGEGVNP